jgi:hypothetical protein
MGVSKAAAVVTAAPSDNGEMEPALQIPDTGGGPRCPAA